MSKNMSDIEKLLKKSKIPASIQKAVVKYDRGNFIDSFYGEEIYSGKALPIGSGQTTDDFVTLARMIALLKPKKTWRVLEVGTGSGYSTAIVASMVKELVSIDVNERLAAASKERVISNGVYNVRFYQGDATDTDMTEELGTFDAIIVYAACRNRPFSLINLINSQGVIVFPMGPPNGQQLVRISLKKKKGEKSVDEKIEFFESCSFESIHGHYGWLNSTPEDEFDEE